MIEILSITERENHAVTLQGIDINGKIYLSNKIDSAIIVDCGATSCVFIVQDD